MNQFTTTSGLKLLPSELPCYLLSTLCKIMPAYHLEQLSCQEHLCYFKMSC